MAARFADLGHDVTIGTRSPEATLARSEPDAMGNPPFSTWAADHAQVSLATFAGAAEQAELVVNATNGSVSVDVLTQAGGDNLAGKVLLDIANPLDFSQGFPPTLFVKDTDSLGEQIQRAFPEVKVVKALNTMTAAIMAEPVLAAGGDHSVFVSGDDRAAKDTVMDLLTSLGHTDVIDLGDLSTARGTEMLLPIWLRLMSALGTPMFNFKIAR
jgi:predicted dinucleotide-binding enzyme